MTRTLEMLSKSKVMYPLVLRMAALFPTMLLQSMGSVINMEYFKLGPRENGLLMAAIGLASAVSLELIYHLITKIEIVIGSVIPNFQTPKETKIS